jgi:hypothetical protein
MRLGANVQACIIVVLVTALERRGRLHLKSGGPP